MEGQGRGRGNREREEALLEVPGAVGVPAEEMEQVERRSLVSAMPWSGQGRGSTECYGQAVGGRDEEEEGETHVGLVGPCVCWCLNIVFCRRDTVLAAWWC